MPSVETIYQKTVKPLPVSDQVRLAEMIIEQTPKASENPERRSVLQMIESYHGKKLGRTAAEIYESIRTERDS